MFYSPDRTGPLYRCVQGTSENCPGSMRVKAGVGRAERRVALFSLHLLLFIMENDMEALREYSLRDKKIPLPGNIIEH